MKRSMLITLALFAALAALLVVAAAAGAGPAAPQGGGPTVVSYQGQVIVSGAPYSGTGYFKFVITDSTAGTSYWSNDGSSTDGGEPSEHVRLIVTNGLFNVLLGDTTLTGMTVALTPDVFAGPDRALRVWFSSDGGGGTFEWIKPDRPIAAVPYALRAAEAAHAAGADSASYAESAYDASRLGGIPPGNGGGNIPISNGTVNNDLSADLLDGAHAGNGSGNIPVSNGALNANLNADLLDGQHGAAFAAFSHNHDGSAITSGKISNARLNTGTGNGLDADLLDGYHAGNANSNIPISNGTVNTSLNADLLDDQHGSYYQTLVSGACDVGATIRAINADGTVICEAHDAYPAFSIAAVDTDGNVGPYTSITIGADGLPIISYRSDSSDRLKVLHCGNVACNSGNTITTIDAPGSSGVCASIAIGADGLPVISYPNASALDLMVLHCGNAACTSGNTITAADNTVTVNEGTSITIGADGLPVIAYIRIGAYALRVLHCGNAACTSGNTITEMGGSGNISDYVAITIGTEGLPVISYYDYANKDLMVQRCGDVACTAGNTVTRVDSDGVVGLYPSITIGADALPVISYYNWTDGDLKVLHCGNAGCTSSNTITAPDTAAAVGLFTSITIGADGLPVVSYYDSSNGNLKVLHCGNVTCTDGNTAWTVESAGDVGSYTSVTIGTDGLPVVSYYDGTNTNLKVLHCSNAWCMPYWRRR